MAIIKTKKNEEKKGEKKGKAWSIVLKRVPVKLYNEGSYILAKLSDDHCDALDSAPCDVELRDGVALFTISRFCRAEICGAPAEISELMGKGWATIKLRHAHYPYTFKGKRGEVNKIELVGINFVTFEPLNESLVNDEDDELTGAEFPEW